jgi:uncharacterized protein
MRLILILLLIPVSYYSFAQNNPGEITASGTAKIKVKPDIAVITFTVEKEEVDESRVLKNLNEEISRLTEILNKIGFTPSHVKIAKYSVSKDDNYNGGRKYFATNTLVVRFNLDNKIIDNVFNAVETEKLHDVNVDLETILSDTLEKATRSTLMVTAIRNAQASANDIAAALGVKLGKVKHASKYGEVYDANYYKNEMVKFTPPKLIGIVTKLQDTSFSDYDVQEVEIEEEITVIYEIKN